MDHEKTYWFPAKKYGWGWGRPRTWQGWAVYAAYGLLLGLGLVALKRTPDRTAAFLLYVLALSVALLAVCWVKGEKRRMHWGRRK